MSGDIPSRRGAQPGATAQWWPGLKSHRKKSLAPASGLLLLVACEACAPRVTRNEPVDAADRFGNVGARSEEAPPAKDSGNEWVIDNTTSIHGVRPTVLGAPVVTATKYGAALCFDGNDDRSKRHPVGVWHWAALSYADGQMRHFVDGIEEASAAIEASPLGAGKTSIGVRQNLVHWFKGCVRKLLVAPRALPAESLERP